MKVPYMLVVGEKEMNEGKVAVRKHGEGDKGAVAVDDFLVDTLEIIKKQLAGKKD